MARKRDAEMQEFPVPLTLRALRKRQGLRQDDVSAALGINRDGISKQENGHTRVQVNHLPILARLYRVPVDVVVRACPPRNGHAEAEEQPIQTWETKVRRVLKELVILEKEKTHA